MPVEPALIAHLYRRATFGPAPGQAAALAAASRDFPAAVATVLGATPSPLPAAPDLSARTTAPIAWWLTRMADPQAGLAEKLTWFWHGHLTSSRAKVNDWALLWKQHLLLRKHALGSFRTLLQEITVDPAMLWYLDGNGSTAAAPNENYGRELMELFALGRGNYTEADVQAAAYALSGWRLDKATGTARFYPARGPATAVTLLGRSVRSTTEVVDTVLAQPACAPWIAGKLYAYLAGVPPTDETRDRLATTFRAGGLEIRPLVTAILADPAFPSMRQNRPRYPVEWLVAAVTATGVAPTSAAQSFVQRAGQVPFRPPNVAGWPATQDWLAPSLALARAAVSAQAPGLDAIAGAADPVAAALERCSLYETTAQTRDALHGAATGITNAKRRAGTLLALALASPEFALA